MNEDGPMPDRSLLIPIVLAAAVCMAVGDARAFDQGLYPSWAGGWTRLRDGKHGNWDPDKPRGLGQQAPLTPEYQSRYEADLADQARGGQGDNPGYRCQAHGMPRIMNGDHPLFFAVTPETTYIMRDITNQLRRIYTDGRDWPAHLQHSANGYSIGTWRDEDGDGRYDALVIETRGLKNPHSYDSSGIPFHDDDAAVIKERLFVDHADAEVMRDEVTVIDHALTRPWTVTRTYQHVRDAKWLEYVCAEDNHNLVIGKDDYLVSQDGFLMPTRKDQGPPDLRYFDRPRP
jgi:hypothetical protein